MTLEGNALPPTLPKRICLKSGVLRTTRCVAMERMMKRARVDLPLPAVVVGVSSCSSFSPFESGSVAALFWDVVGVFEPGSFASKSSKSRGGRWTLSLKVPMPRSTQRPSR